jgi:hypothetical protein
MDTGLQWDVAPVEKTAARQILETRAGARALALIQIGENDLAEKEMHQLLQGKGQGTRAVILAVAQAANLPSLSLRLGVQYRTTPARPRSRDLSPAAGAAERPDRSALLFADAAGRQQPQVSHAGASGLVS